MKYDNVARVSCRDKSLNGSAEKEGRLGVIIKTKPFGTIEIKEEQIFSFPDGIYGFEDVNKFVFLEEEDSILMWMQAFSEQSLAFVVVQMEDVVADYKLQVSQQNLDDLKVRNPKELKIYGILTIPEKADEMTINLQGPVLVNPVARIGKQAISLNERYTTKHRLIEEIERSRRIKE